MKTDGMQIARQNELRVLKSLHKFGWLRTRDLAALHWMPKQGKEGVDFQPIPLEVTTSALRMAQRTLARLRRDNKVLHIQAPDGSTIYGLAEAGVRQLVDLGIPAKSGKDLVRRVSLSHYHHRRLANEMAIIGLLQGYRVATEAEISAGQWLGGMNGFHSKKPDVLVRDGKKVWWVEVERSRRNAKDHTKLLQFLGKLWNQAGHADLHDGYKIEKVVFVCNPAFIERVRMDLKSAGWTESMLTERVSAIRLLYVTEGKYLIKPKTVAQGADIPAD